MADLVLVEFAEDATHLASTNPPSAAIVSLRPESADVLDARSIPYTLQTSIERHAGLDAVAAENLVRLDRLAALSEVPMSPGVRLRTLDAHYQQVLILLDVFAFAVEQLRWLVAEHRPRTVTYFEAWRLSRTLLPDPVDSIWSALCGWLRDASEEQRPEWARGVVWIGRATVSSPRRIRRRIRRQNADGTLMTRLKTAPGISSRVRTLRGWLSQNARRPVQAPAGGTGTRLLFVGTSPDIAAVRTALRSERDYDVWMWDGKAPVRERSRERLVAASAVGDEDGTAATTIAASALASPLLTWSGVSGHAVMKPKWQALLDRLPATVRRFAHARALVDSLAPQAVVHGEIGLSHQMRTVIEAARSLGIPTVFQQWGGNYGYIRQPYLAGAELRSSGVIAYTSPVAECLRQNGTGGRLDVRIAASPYFATLRSRLGRSASSPAGRPCIYVPSPLVGPLRYGPSLMLDDSLQHRVQRRVVASLAPLAACPFVLKVAPRRVSAVDPLDEWLRRTSPAATIDHRPLDQLLDEPAVWVTDGPATTLQQVTLSGEPVIFVDTRGATWYPDARRCLERTVTVVDAWSPDFEARLRSAVVAALDTPRAAFIDDDSFANRYAVPDMPPAEASAQVIEQLVRLSTPLPAAMDFTAS